MPACLTHYYFAQSVREDLPDKASLDSCAYAWGAQGPDFFFCHRFLPFWKGESIKEYGTGFMRRLLPKCWALCGIFSRPIRTLCIGRMCGGSCVTIL